MTAVCLSACALATMLWVIGAICLQIRIGGLGQPRARVNATGFDNSELDVAQPLMGQGVPTSGVPYVPYGQGVPVGRALDNSSATNSSAAALRLSMRAAEAPSQKAGLAYVSC